MAVTRESEWLHISHVLSSCVKQLEKKVAHCASVPLMEITAGQQRGSSRWASTFLLSDDGRRRRVSGFKHKMDSQQLKNSYFFCPDRLLLSFIKIRAMNNTRVQWKSKSPPRLKNWVWEKKRCIKRKNYLHLLPHAFSHYITKEGWESDQSAQNHWIQLFCDVVCVVFVVCVFVLTDGFVCSLLLCVENRR